MEKKTIGRFISVLRKANGMTQKELGEKLFVSDKTVSRWERDECTPELSLIPAIAEIFGITTDELLRGERNNLDYHDNVERQNVKSDKQFKLMLHNNQKKYKNHTLISIGITILGLISAMIANLAFSEGLIAFCLACAFCVASEICQICFAINARILLDDDDATYNDRIKEANTKVIKTSITISFVNVSLFAFCLPLVAFIDGANLGLAFDSWIGLGLICTLIALSLSYIIYSLFIRKHLCDHKLIIINESEKNKITYSNKLLKKTIFVAVSIAVFLCILIIVLNNFGADLFTEKLSFDNCADFKAFMESDYDRWLEEGYSYYYDIDGNIISLVPIYPSVEDSDEKLETEDAYYPEREYGIIKNEKGEVICEYYYNPSLYIEIIFTPTANDKMPVTVITNESSYNALSMVRDIESILYFLLVVDFTVAACIYLLKTRRKKS